ncbi:hypothetical protein CBW65_10595 [Tumebacillus avium]|uniref:Glycosyltransferase RgtA/B/C/D-like domain-containing protein n=1 Tax=Tumebacillus avium TaxID=1903704 RepID=A0A1Y0IM96_9BACL|nr:hypothetical protein [Tumebacillus avium]ARU61400.1 hypothetical protein CBW65_10595 [Tumebacillus avium]
MRRIVEELEVRGGTPLWLQPQVALGLAVAALVWVVVRCAWVSDDAYITFRTVDNLLHGYGLTWNVGERVQAYTHPLWMFLMAVLAGVTGEVFLTSIGLSVAVTLLSLWVLARKVALNLWTAAAAVGMLALSKAFVDYSTSGLENPLTHLLLAVFFLLLIKERGLLWLALCTALLMVNRMDTVLLVAPALAVAFWREKGGWARKTGLVAAGLLPFWLWEGFSAVYYGFLVPNTAFAKLGTGIGAWESAQHGLFYLLNSLRLDPLTLVLICCGALLGLRSRDWRKAALAAGAVLYVAYVVKIGGDFMSGRFLTAPLLVAVMLLATFPLPKRLLAAALLLGVTSPYAPLWSGADYGLQRADVIDRHGIADERAFYYSHAGLLRVREPDHPWAEEGKRASTSGYPVQVKATVGYYGYYAGPGVQIIDPFALGDPLLARLPFFYKADWRVGHFERVLPRGYAETLRTGENRLADKNLARYYDKLALITRGDLLSQERLAAVWEMNRGAYEHWIDQEAYKTGAAIGVKRR